MCNECRQKPCDNRCPNANSPPVIDNCCRCKKDIFDGDIIYKIDNETWCDECVEDTKTTAELEEPDYNEDR